MATISISRVVIQHKTKKFQKKLITHDFYKQKNNNKMFRIKL